MPDGEDDKKLQEFVNEACSDVDEEEEETQLQLREAATDNTPMNINVENSSDVQVGPRLLYNAPVTVNQHLHVVKGEGDVLQYALKAPLHEIHGEFKTSEFK